jgi:uncharacterized membrane protein
MSPLLYCGDTDLASAASYLAGLLTHGALPFEYVPSHVPLVRDQLEQPRPLYVFSDYPAALADRALQRLVVERVAHGAGLLMIGGWESFHGMGGNWDGTPIGEILPVEISPQDDRVNFPQSAYIRTDDADHRLLAGLPWSQPPAIGGMNRVIAKPDAHVGLWARPVHVTALADDWRFHADDELPLLVTGRHGAGRVAAITTDVAPHWVGGFVDWGDGRVTAQADGAPAIEVGNWYAQFWRQLIGWTMGGN